MALVAGLAAPRSARAGDGEPATGEPARAAGAAPRVGVVVSAGVNLEPEEAERIAGALGRALRARLVVDVIAGAEASRRLPAGGVPASCVVEPACVADLAGRLSADELLLLALVKVGTRIQLDATWIEPATGRAVPRPAIELEVGEDPAPRLAAAAPDMLPDAAVRPPAPPPAEPTRLVEPDRIVLEPRPRRMTAPAWIAAGAGAAALVGAVGFTIAARGDYQDCRSSEPACSDAALDSLERKALAADLLWGTAAVGGIAAGVLYWMSGGELEPVGGAAALRVGPAAGGGLAVSLEGRL